MVTTNLHFEGFQGDRHSIKDVFSSNVDGYALVNTLLKAIESTNDEIASEKVNKEGFARIGQELISWADDLELKIKTFDAYRKHVYSNRKYFDEEGKKQKGYQNSYADKQYEAIRFEIEQKLQEGYVMIHRIFEFLTGQPLQYKILVKENNELVELTLTMEELFSEFDLKTSNIKDKENRISQVKLGIKKKEGADTSKKFKKDSKKQNQKQWADLIDRFAGPGNFNADVYRTLLAHKKDLSAANIDLLNKINESVESDNSNKKKKKKSDLSKVNNGPFYELYFQFIRDDNFEDILNPSWWDDPNNQSLFRSRMQEILRSPAWAREGGDQAAYNEDGQIVQYQLKNLGKSDSVSLMGSYQMLDTMRGLGQQLLDVTQAGFADALDRIFNQKWRQKEGEVSDALIDAAAIKASEYLHEVLSNIS